MTPRPAPVPYYREREREAEAPRAESSLKGEAVKYLVSMLVAGLTAYFATIYGIREEVAVLKVHLEYLKQKVDAQSQAIDRLTTSVNTHMLTYHPTGTGQP